MLDPTQMAEEPMDTSELLYDYDEEGEIHSTDDEDDNKILKFKTNKVQPVKTNLFSSTLVNKSEEARKLERAKRFALTSEATVQSINNDDISQLHKSLGIDKENERHYRFNVVHMRGTQDMSTEDVFEYFAGYSPLCIEWINDVSCNIIWADDVSAAHVLLSLSKEIKNLDKIHLNGDPFQKDLMNKKCDMEYSTSVSGNFVDARQIKMAIPPGSWRIGVPSKKNNEILLRYATRSDRKQKHAERNSEYYKRYGNPHFGNLPGLVSNSLRNAVFRKKFGGRNKGKSNQFDMDGGDSDENEKKNPWGGLAQEWNELDKILTERDMKARLMLKRPHPSAQKDLRVSINSRQEQRLGFARSRQTWCRSSSQSGSEDDEEEIRKFPRMKMYADEEEESEKKSRPGRGRLGSYIRVPVVEDLRSKIDRRRRNKEMLSRSQGKKSARQHWSKFSSTRDDEYSDERDSPKWALEQYADLRESLTHNKRNRARSKQIHKFESDDEEVGYDESDNVYSGGLGSRSPLQIEIENDEYFEKESDSTF